MKTSRVSYNEIYFSGKQYSSKDPLLEVIKKATREVTASNISKLTIYYESNVQSNKKI